jgi:hypothetical protein
METGVEISHAVKTNKMISQYSLVIAQKTAHACFAKCIEKPSSSFRGSDKVCVYALGVNMSIRVYNYHQHQVLLIYEAVYSLVLNVSACVYALTSSGHMQICTYMAVYLYYNYSNACQHIATYMHVSCINMRMYSYDM